MPADISAPALSLNTVATYNGEAGKQGHAGC